MSLRIAHVQPQTLDLYGHRDEDLGGDVTYFVSNTAEAQARRGHQPTIFLLSSDRRRKSISFRGVRADFFPCLQPPRFLADQRRFARQFSLRFLRAIRALAPDVVHFHGVRQFHLMLGAVGIAADRAGVPLIGREDGYRPVGAIERRAQLAGLRRTAAVLAASESGAEELMSLGFRADRLFVVPNGYSPSVFFAGTSEPPSRDERVRLLSVMRLDEEKGALTLVDAVGEIAARGVVVDVRIAGEGPLRHVVEDGLRRSGAQYELLGNVSQRELADHYRWAQIYCLPSRSEGSNQSVIEAMASGAPVVATDIPGIRETAGTVGILVRPDRPLELAEAIDRLLTNPREWEERRAAGLKSASTLTWDAHADCVDAVYALALDSVRPA